MPVAPISLYIDLEPDRSVELEAVARASLEFAAGLREAAYLFDPSFEFRIELERSNEGSLWLKAVLRWIRGLGFPEATMYGITLAASGWFADKTLDYGYQALLDHLTASKNPEIVRLAPEQVQEIAQRAARVAAAPEPGVHFRSVYRELQRDTAVRGVGVAPWHDTPPTMIVPRSEFDDRIVGQAEIILPGERRTRLEHGDFVIIRPVLKEGGGRWRLRGPGGEFSATIADDSFYNDILTGNAPVRLAAEIHIVADLEVQEERTREGAWQPLSYRIAKVHSIAHAPIERRLIPPRGEE